MSDTEIENIIEKENFKMNNKYSQITKEYLYLILYDVNELERYGLHPVIVMSKDIISLLTAYTENLIVLSPDNKITCWGYDVKLAFGSDVLLVAYNLRSELKGE